MAGLPSACTLAHVHPPTPRRTKTGNNSASHTIRRTFGLGRGRQRRESGIGGGGGLAAPVPSHVDCRFLFLFLVSGLCFLGQQHGTLALPSRARYIHGHILMTRVLAAARRERGILQPADTSDGRACCWFALGLLFAGALEHRPMHPGHDQRSRIHGLTASNQPLPVIKGSSSAPPCASSALLD